MNKDTKVVLAGCPLLYRDDYCDLKKYKKCADRNDCFMQQLYKDLTTYRDVEIAINKLDPIEVNDEKTNN